MNVGCDKEWDRQTLIKKLTPSFVNSKFKDHLGEVLFEKEKALLPATQLVLEQINRRVELENKIKETSYKLKKQNEIASNYRYIHKHNYTGNLFCNVCYIRFTPWDDHNCAPVDIDLLLKERKQCKENLKTLRLQLDSNEDPEVPERNKFIKKCPNLECRGFLSSQWKCGLCNMWSCPDCHCLKGPEKTSEHNCKAEDVATAKLLDKDSKPCPSCGAVIFKISGCNQMWCTQCRTTFDWQSLRIETGNIHNPHYLEYARHSGTLDRNPLDIQCGRELDHNFAVIFDRMFIRGIPRKERETCEERRNANRIIRNLSELRAYKITALLREQEDLLDNLDLRLKYLQNDIDDTAFKILLQRRKKKYLKSVNLCNLYQMVVNCATDIFYRYYDELVKTPSLQLHEKYSKEFEGIRSYANECLKVISKDFQSVQLTFHTDFYLTNAK
jgi:hypothetical protein